MKRKINYEKETLTLTMTLDEMVSIATAISLAADHWKDIPSNKREYHKLYKELMGRGLGLV